MGVNILKDEFNMKGNCVLDPCFLLDGNDFLFGKIIESKKILVSYKLSYDRFYDLELRKLGKMLGCKVNRLRYKYVSSLPNCKDLNVGYCDVEEWLYSIASASYVVTDSFHGMVFSILFKKQFVIFPLNPKHSSRIDDLLKKLNMLHRKVYSWNDANNLFGSAPIDYSIVHERLSILRQKSICELQNMLS